ncbi:hypothetical protein LIV57_05730 [Chryseobacterium sp. X308]|uniref:hypothetical protein n=1 Tax=Chryseobacterium sp. X308 TaxID=2884873 RepID=UPI001D13D968|nr:hypothetical protein [Chryseobacterium sp. X308]MCC3214762.1 hypothetical protein [Chryseobacterium sp. X308]
MKSLILLLFSFVHFNAQIKLNTKQEVDILFQGKEFSLDKIFDGKDPYMFKIVNNTNNTYIIDPYGFKNDNFVMTCDENIVTPDKAILKGFYKRFDDKDCFNDLIILKPKEEKYAILSIINLKGWYDLDKEKKYILRLNSTHNNYTVILLGCQSYIRELVEKKGYKVLEDSFIAKIPFVP